MKTFYKRVITFLLITLVLSQSTLYSLCEELEKTEQIELERIDEIERIDLEETEMLRLSTTASGVQYLYMDSEEFLEENYDNLMSTVARKWGAFSDSVKKSYNDFLTWLDSEVHVDIYTDWPECRYTVEEQTQEPVYDVPQEVQDYLVQFLVYNIQQENPLNYTECYVSSYNFMSTSNFSNANAYYNAKEIIKQCNGFAFTCVPNGWGTGTQNNLYIVTVDRSKYDVNFIGTTTQGGFTNVNLERKWNVGFTWPDNADGVDYYMIRLSNGKVGHGKTPSAAAQAAGYDSSYRPSTSNIKNTTNPYPASTTNNVFSSNEKNELVYVFKTLNAYKNYNAGMAQPYYLTSEGVNTPMSQWTATGGSMIAGGDLSYYGQSYQTITTQTQSGWTAEQVLELVQTILQGSGGSGSGSGSGSGGGVFDFLGDIGDAVGSLVRGLGEFIAEVIGGIVDAVLDLLNIFVGDDGLLSKLTNLINTGFNNFLSAVFSWLPPEIVTIFTASIVVGIFFAIWKMIRG